MENDLTIRIGGDDPAWFHLLLVGEQSIKLEGEPTGMDRLQAFTGHALVPVTSILLLRIVSGILAGSAYPLDIGCYQEPEQTAWSTEDWSQDDNSGCLS